MYLYEPYDAATHPDNQTNCMLQYDGHRFAYPKPEPRTEPTFAYCTVCHLVLKRRRHKASDNDTWEKVTLLVQEWP